MTKAYLTALQAHESWQRTGWLRAFAYLAQRGGGPVENRDLAQALGYDPRGLRQLISARPEFLIEIRASTGKCKRGVPYYRLNPNCMTTPPEPRHRALLDTIVPAVRIESGNLAEVTQDPEEVE